MAGELYRVEFRRDGPIKDAIWSPLTRDPVTPRELQNIYRNDPIPWKKGLRRVYRLVPVSIVEETVYKIIEV